MTTQTNTTNGRLFDAKTVAARLGVRVKRVYELDIPRVQVSERTVRWLEDDVNDWIAKRREAR